MQLLLLSAMARYVVVVVRVVRFALAVTKSWLALAYSMGWAPGDVVNPVSVS